MDSSRNQLESSVFQVIMKQEGNVILSEELVLLEAR